MTDIGSTLGRAGQQVGVGYSTPPEPVPVTQDAITASFEGGINLADSPEDLDPAQAQHLIGMEINRDGSIGRAGGPQLVEDGAGSKNVLFKQTSLDFSAELIAIDPPNIGIKDISDMVFHNAGIVADAGEGWFGASIAGQLIFSNGVNATYVRDPNTTTTLINVTDQIIARCFAQAFGRVFAGGVTLPGGDYQGLGVAWSSAGSPVEDWTGIGSGAELLIGDNDNTDKVVSMRSIGLDLLGICNRSSLWAGYKTGNIYRPADFRPRVNGVGAVSHATVCATPMGIIMLTDDGVGVFDINNFRVLSRAINPALLPLDYAQLSRYQAAYDQQNGRYLLQTPNNQLFVYDLPRMGTPERWTIWTSSAKQLIFFAQQTGLAAWDRQTSSWDADIRTWDEATQRQSIAPEELYLGEDDELSQWVPLNSVAAGGCQWVTPLFARTEITRQFITHAFELEYSATDATTVTFFTPSSTGTSVSNEITKVLPTTGGIKRRVMIWGLRTGQNIALGLRIDNTDTGAGTARFFRIRQVVMDSGAAINSTIP